MDDLTPILQLGDATHRNDPNAARALFMGVLDAAIQCHDTPEHIRQFAEILRGATAGVPEGDHQQFKDALLHSLHLAKTRGGQTKDFANEIALVRVIEKRMREKGVSQAKAIEWVLDKRPPELSAVAGQSPENLKRICSAVRKADKEHDDIVLSEHVSAATKGSENG